MSLGASAAPRDRGGESLYFVVFLGGTSGIHHLPTSGEVIVGRSRAAQLALDHRSVSRRHARISIDGSELVLSDLGSRNGSRVNGVRITAPRRLAAGDVVALGEATLVLHRSARASARPGVADFAQLRRRLEEEIERAVRFGRGLTLLHLDAAAGTPSVRRRLAGALAEGLRLMDVGAWDADGRLVVLLPETLAAEALAAAGTCLGPLLALAPAAKVGYAVCPDDGCDADTLIAGARAGAEAAGPGEIRAAAAAAKSFRIGEHELVAVEPAMLRAFGLIERLAATDIPVLIAGETGSGKELAAAAVHHGSPRRKQPMVVLNCAAIPEPLIESELFGYEKGAFSGAVAAKAGLFESATFGTVFLDEVGELSPSAQAKLLRALETQRIMRLGATRERAIDIRLVAATHRDLPAEVSAGRFREDLYFRLGAATVVLPPLRDRPRDVPLLARLFLERACARARRTTPSLAAATMRALLGYRWPGNVRELKNVMEFLAAAVSDPVIEPELLPPAITRQRSSLSGPATVARPAPAMPEPIGSPLRTLEDPREFKNLGAEVRHLEQSRMQAALDAAAGNQSRAAELIGMPRRTFVAKMKQYGISARAK